MCWYVFVNITEKQNEPEHFFAINGRTDSWINIITSPSAFSLTDKNDPLISQKAHFINHSVVVMVRSSDFIIYENGG